MKKALYIAYYTIIRNFRDYKSLSQMLMIPIVTILILGTALNSAFEVQNLKKKTVLIVNEDKGIFSEKFVEVLKVPQLKDLLEVKEVKTEEEAVRQVKEEKAAAYVKLAGDFSRNIIENKKAEIEVNSLSRGVAVMVLENVADTFASNVNLQQALVSGNLQPAEFVDKNFIKTLPLSAKSSIPSAMDYYSITILVMITLYGSLYAVNGMADDYINSMRIRLKSAPVSQISHYVGKITGMVATVYLQVILLIFFTKFVYGANWGDNYPLIFFIALSLTVLSVAMGVAAVFVIKRTEAANGFISVLVPVMTFLAGGYTKINTNNVFFSTVRKILPSGLGQTAFFNLIYGDSMGRTALAVATMWLLIGVLGAVAVVSGRRRLN